MKISLIDQMPTYVQRKAGQVVVVGGSLQGRSSAFDQLQATLSDEEWARAARFLSAEHQDNFVIAHGLKRRILADYLGVEPASLTFHQSEQGKPALLGADLCFNLTHTKQFMCLAISDAPVGIDVESFREGIQVDELVNRFFSAEEKQAFSEFSLSASHHEKTRAFIRAWTRKEAYLKATGVGLSRGMSHFTVSFDETPAAGLISIGERSEVYDNGTHALVHDDSWECYSHQVDDMHYMSVVARSPLESISITWI